MDGLNLKRKRRLCMTVSDSDEDKEMTFTDKKIQSESPCSPTCRYDDSDYEPKAFHCDDDDADDHEEINSGIPSSPRPPSTIRVFPTAFELQRPPSQPLLPALWAGGFTVKDQTTGSTTTYPGLNGFLSSKACEAVRHVVDQLPEAIQWERLPRCSVWPKSFESRSGPVDDDLAVFFFPSLTKHRATYDSLLFDLIRHDSALRSPVPVMGSKDVELLLFTSMELPHPSMRFQGKLFLWGVIRGKHL